jgi:hypothetical protein
MTQIVFMAPPLSRKISHDAILRVFTSGLLGFVLVYIV